jgi:hypothetical protein
LKVDHRVRLPLIRGSDGGWILIPEVSVSNRLSEAVPLHHPILDAPLLPFSLVVVAAVKDPRYSKTNSAANAAGLRLMCWSSPVSHTQ